MKSAEWYPKRANEQIADVAELKRITALVLGSTKQSAVSFEWTKAWRRAY